MPGSRLRLGHPLPGPGQRPLPDVGERNGDVQLAPVDRRLHRDHRLDIRTDLDGHVDRTHQRGL
jgi:hypothetical protein